MTTHHEHARLQASAARAAAVTAAAEVKAGSPDRATALRLHDNWVAACSLANHLEAAHAALLASDRSGAQ